MRVRPLLIVLSLVAGVLAAVPAGAATPRVLRLGTPPKSVRAGARLRIAVRVRPASAKLRVSLSRDRRRDKKDPVLGSARARKGKLSLAVPKRVKPAAYHVIACAGKRCLVSRRTVRVTAAAPGKPPATIPAPGPGPDLPPGAGATGGVNPFAGLPSLATAPSPVAVHPALDAAHAASKTIGTGGGSVTATGADGSTYTLTIPAGALLSDEPITLTPVTAIDGLPFTTAAPAAVQLGPDGLGLQSPAALTIVPAHPAPLDEQTGFGWHGNGADFHMTPVGTDAAKIVLTLWHFSGAGVGGATPEQRAAQQQHVPQTPQDRLDQQLAQARDAIRRGDPISASTEADWFVSAFDNVVLPAIQAAAQDDTRITDAVTALLSWAHDTAVLTDPDHADARIKARFDQVGPLLAALLDAAYAKAKQACDAGDPSQVARMLQVARLQAILGLPASPVLADAAKCTSFKLSLDDHITYKQLGSTVDGDWRFDQLPLALDLSGHATATTSLQDGGWSVSSGPWMGDSRCTASKASTTPSSPMPVDLQLDANWRTETDAQGITRDVVGPAQFTIRLGEHDSPVNTFNINCVDGHGNPQPPIPTPMPLWVMGWMSRESWIGADGVITMSYTGSGGSPIVDVTTPGHTPYPGTDAVVDDTLHVVLEHAG